MAGGSFAALQEALYDKLAGDATLSGLISGVRDYAPHEVVFPYVQIGHITSVPWDAKDFDGEEQTVTIHSWSQYAGSKEVKQIMDRVRDLLHKGTISVTGHSVILIRCEFSEVMKDPDSITHHGVQRFRIITEEA